MENRIFKIIVTNKTNVDEVLEYQSTKHYIEEDLSKELFDIVKDEDIDFLWNNNKNLRKDVISLLNDIIEDKDYKEIVEIVRSIRYKTNGRYVYIIKDDLYKEFKKYLKKDINIRIRRIKEIMSKSNDKNISSDMWYISTLAYPNFGYKFYDMYKLYLYNTMGLYQLLCTNKTLIIVDSYEYSC